MAQRSKSLLRPSALGETPNFRSKASPQTQTSGGINSVPRRRSSENQIHGVLPPMNNQKSFRKEPDQKLESATKALNNSASLSFLEGCDPLNPNANTLAYARHCQLVADLAQAKRENGLMQKRIKELEETIRNETINYEEQRAFIEMLKETINEKLESIGILESLQRASKQIARHNSGAAEQKLPVLPECGTPVDLYLEIVNMKNNIDFLERELEKSKDGTMESRMAAGQKDQSIRELEGLVCSLEKNEKRIMDYFRRIQEAIGSDGASGELPPLGFVEGDHNFNSFYRQQDVVAVIEAMKRKSREDDENLFEMNESIQQLQRETQDLQSEIHSLNAELESKADSELHLNEKYREIERAFDEVSSENKELREALSAEEATLHQLEGKLKAMEGVNEERSLLIENKRALDEKLKNEAQKSSKFSQENEELRKKTQDLEKWKRIAEEVEKQLKETQNESERQHQKIKKQEEMSMELRKENEKLQNELIFKGRMIDRMALQFDGSSGENKRLIEQNARLMIESRNLESQKKESQSMLQSLGKKLEETLEKERELEQKWQELAQENQKAKKSEEFLCKLNGSDEELLEFAKARLMLEEICKESEAFDHIFFRKSSEQNEKSSESRRNRQKTPNDLIKMLKELPGLLSERASQMKTIIKSEKELKSREEKTRKEKEEAINENEDLKKGLKEAMSHLKLLENEGSYLKTEINSTREMVLQIQNEKEKTKEEVEALRIQNQEMAEYVNELLLSVFSFQICWS